MGSGVWVYGAGLRPAPVAGEAGDRARDAREAVAARRFCFLKQNRSILRSKIERGSAKPSLRRPKAVAARGSTPGRPPRSKLDRGSGVDRRSTLGDLKFDRRKAIDRRSTQIDFKIDRRKAINRSTDLDREAIEKSIAVRRSSKNFLEEKILKNL